MFKLNICCLLSVIWVQSYIFRFRKKLFKVVMHTNLFCKYYWLFATSTQTKPGVTTQILLMPQGKHDLQFSSTHSIINYRMSKFFASINQSINALQIWSKWSLSPSHLLRLWSWNLLTSLIVYSSASSQPAKFWDFNIYSHYNDMFKYVNYFCFGNRNDV